MKKLFTLLLILSAISLNAALVNKSGNVLKVQKNGLEHAIIEIYANASDSAALIIGFSTYIGDKLELAKDSAEWVEGKTLNETETELLETIIIEESTNGGLLKYKPDLDIVLIEELTKY